MKRRRLSRDEDALWRRATRDVRRLKELSGGDPLTEKSPGPLGPRTGETSRDTAFPVKSQKMPPLAAPGKKPAPPSAFEGGDPALERRARRGRLPPERTIDLHGMSQLAARIALTSFLEKAHTDGVRCVLVITGKGAPGVERDYLADRAPRGVIRRRFAEWIDEPPLRKIVTRAAPAAPKDGGSGAFYVFLKRKTEHRRL